MNVPWSATMPASPSACNPGMWCNGVGADCNSTKVSVSASGAVSVYVYGTADAVCKGPVYTSFVGLTYSPGNTLTAGTCTAATTSSFARPPQTGQQLAWVRIVAASAFTHGQDPYCPQAAAATGAGSAGASSGSTTGTPVGSIVAAVVVPVIAIGAAVAAAWHYRVFMFAPSAKDAVHGVNPASRV
jgi:hypothetical protein